MMFTFGDTSAFPEPAANFGEAYYLRIFDAETLEDAGYIS